MEWQKAVEFPPIIIHCTHRQYCLGSVHRHEEGKIRKYLLTIASFMVTYYLVRYFFRPDIAATVSRSRRRRAAVVCLAVIQYQACHR